MKLLSFFSRGGETAQSVGFACFQAGATPETRDREDRLIPGAAPPGGTRTGAARRLPTNVGPFEFRHPSDRSQEPNRNEVAFLGPQGPIFLRGPRPKPRSTEGLLDPKRSFYMGPDCAPYYYLLSESLNK